MSVKGKGHAAKHSSEASYVVSKIDAGQAVLISDQVQCIEFPSVLLPPGCTTGSVVNISCSRNVKEEKARSDDFWNLQDEILSAFGDQSPHPPSMRLRNVTQTSVTLEWDKLELATAKLLSLTIWRNGQRLAAIPNPLNNTSTKLSGLDVDAPYSFHLILKTTAGTFASQTIKTRTLTLTDTSGIAVCFGAVHPPELLEEAKEALGQMKARSASRIQIETTHFVCTHPSSLEPLSSPASPDVPNPAMEYQRAVQLSIPIVHPSWITACLREKRMVPISQHTVSSQGASPSTVTLQRPPPGRRQTQPAPAQPQEEEPAPVVASQIASTSSTAAVEETTVTEELPEKSAAQDTIEVVGGSSTEQTESTAELEAVGAENMPPAAEDDTAAAGNGASAEPGDREAVSEAVNQSEASAVAISEGTDESERPAAAPADPTIEGSADVESYEEAVEEPSKPLDAASAPEDGQEASVEPETSLASSEAAPSAPEAGDSPRHSIDADNKSMEDVKL